MRKSLPCSACMLVLFLAGFAPLASAWSNGGYSSDPYNPDYGTHDYLFEHTLNMLPAAEKSAIVHNLSLALYGTEMPDNPSEIGDTSNHHVYYNSSGQLTSDPAADRAQAEYDLALGYLWSGDYNNADKRIGAMSHYITDVTVFGHVMGAYTDWGAEVHHSDYEDYVRDRTASYTSPTFDSYIVYDGSLSGMSAYDATVNLAYTITFGSGSVKSCTWMDSNYSWSNATFKDSAGASMNLAVNYLAEVLHKLYLDFTSPVNNAPTLSSGSVSPSSGITSTTFTYEVTYADADGDAPSYVNVYTDGTPHSMTKISGTYTGGALYRYTTTLGVGSHTYYFQASDGKVTARLPITGTYSGPTVSEAPQPPTPPPPEDNTPPPTPSLVSPTNGANIIGNTPLLDWSDVSDPSGVTYDLSIARDAGFVSIALQKIDLTASTYELTPAEALVAGTYYWRARAVDGVGNIGSWSENWSFTVSIAPRRGVRISILPAESDTENGYSTTFSVTVMNTGNVADNYSLTVGDNSGWGPTLSENSLLNVENGASRMVTLTVTIPENAENNTRDDVTVTARSRTDNAIENSASCIAHCVIAPPPLKHGVQVSISPESQTGLPGKNLTSTVTVKNTGEAEDTYGLTVSDDALWGARLDENTLTILALESTTVTVSVTVPSNASEGDSTMITVTAMGADYENSATCTATATGTPAPSGGVSPLVYVGAAVIIVVIIAAVLIIKPF